MLYGTIWIVRNAPALFLIFYYYCTQRLFVTQNYYTGPVSQVLKLVSRNLREGVKGKGELSRPSKPASGVLFNIALNVCSPRSNIAPGLFRRSWNFLSEFPAPYLILHSMFVRRAIILRLAGFAGLGTFCRNLREGVRWKGWSFKTFERGLWRPI